MSIQAYDINLAPAGSQGSTQIIEATAQICDFLTSGSAFDTIEVRPNFMQGAATLKLGQGFDFGAPVDRWLIVNKGTTAVSGQVMLSTAGFRNFRISGDVNVLDGSKSRTLNNTAFTGFTSAPGVAAQYPRIQLWNPATSGVRLVLESLTGMSAVTSCAVILTDSTAALATNVQQGLPKLLGGTNSKGEIHDDSTAVAQPGNPSLMVISAAPGLGLQSLKFVEPVIIPPGHGLLMTGNTQNDPFSCSFEWYEEANT